MMGIYDKMRSLVDNGAGPMDSLLGRRKLDRSKKSPPVRDNSADHAVSAMMHASATRGIEEQHRPNAAYCVVNDATAAVADGVSQDCTCTLNTADTSIHYFFARDVDCANFVCVSFKVDGFEMIKGKPVPLTFLIAWLNRIDRPTPLVGRTFKNGTEIAARVQNVSGGPVRFAGVGVAVQEPLCNKDLRSSKPSSAMFGYGAYKSVWGSFFKRRTTRR